MSIKHQLPVIAFFYYKYYPIKGGASVHGYNLAKELSKKGYTLYKLNGDKDLFTTKEEGIWGLLKVLVKADVVFVRLDYFFKARNIIPLIAKAMGKPVIAELNSPSDELFLLGYGKTTKWVKEKWLKFIVGYVDKVVTVSQPVKNFCTTVLGHTNVDVIENGGEVFNVPDSPDTSELIEKIKVFRTKYSKIVIWTGTVNKIQELDFLVKVGRELESKYALVIITPEKFSVDPIFEEKKNIYRFSAVNRAELGFVINQADIGLAFFTDYDWCKWGYYGSSLKVYEYLSNNTFVITNKEEVFAKHKMIKLLTEPSQINTYCKEISKKSFEGYHPRTWSQVAEEFLVAVNEVLNEHK